MIDLHVHTSRSDGSFSTIDILKKAEEKHLDVLSICDHNVVDAYDDIKDIDVKDYFSGKIIPGIEFDFAYKGKIFHLLGYNYDIEKLRSSKFISTKTPEELMDEQKENLEFFKKVCANLGIKLSPNLEITKPHQQANDIIKIDMQIHPENDQILDDILGKDRKTSFWLGHVTNPESPFYIDFTKGLPSVQEVANDIHSAGGLVVLPHTFEYKSIDNIEFLNDMYNLGVLDGVECVHTKHSLEQVMYLENFCKEKHLLMSGGSDFHDDRYEIGKTSIGPIDNKYCLKYP